MKADINFSGGIVIDSQNKLLVVREKNRDYWTMLGGVIETGENSVDCLKREVKEELGVNILGEPVFYVKSPFLDAVGEKNKKVQATVYLINLDGKPKPNQEVEEIRWFSKNELLSGKYRFGNILQKFLISLLVKDELI